MTDTRVVRQLRQERIRTIHFLLAELDGVMLSLAERKRELETERDLHERVERDVRQREERELAAGRLAAER